MASINADTTVRLRILDGTVYTVDKKNAFLSATIRQIAEENPNGEEIYLEKIKSKTVMDLMVEYMNHCQGVVKPEIKEPLRSTTWIENCNDDEFDAELSERSYQNSNKHLEAMLAARDLHLTPLYLLLCARLAFEIMGKDIEECKEIIHEYIR